MYYLIKHSTLGTIKPQFITGGVGVNYKDKSNTLRYVTCDQSKALKFSSVKDALEYACQGYVVCKQLNNKNFIAV